MTFQVAIAAIDGLIVGSDRKVAVRSSQHGLKAEWQYASGNKFVKRSDESVVCFYAGGPRSKSIAHAIENRANPFEVSVSRWEESLKEIADSLHAEHSSNDEVLVIRKHVPDVTLLSAPRPGTGASTGTLSIEQRVCTGVPVTARFLTQHLWKSAPIAKLKSLALLTLGFAAREQPGSIGEGFDLVSIPASGVPEWERYAAEDERIAELCYSFQQTMLGAIYLHSSAIDQNDPQAPPPSQERHAKKNSRQM